MKYVLGRKTDSVFSVGINPRFYLKPQTGNTIAAGKEAVKEMKSKINDCLKQINPGLIDGNGARIEVAVLNETDSDAKDVRMDVEIDRDIARTNSTDNSFRSGITCMQIAHEVGHLLGLVDEYTDKTKANSSTGRLYDCRSRSIAPSLMSHHEEKSF